MWFKRVKHILRRVGRVKKGKHPRPKLTIVERNVVHQVLIQVLITYGRVHAFSAPVWGAGAPLGTLVTITKASGIIGYVQTLFRKVRV